MHYIFIEHTLAVVRLQESQLYRLDGKERDTPIIRQEIHAQEDIGFPQAHLVPRAQPIFIAGSLIIERGSAKVRENVMMLLIKGKG
ncbi:hypothetical protein BL248_22920 [Ralstonia solanacearum]|nr:hypothetical protein BL248_22920 [Ralstonia solanacearum]